MSRESQNLAIARLTKAIAFIRELPEWVDVKTADISGREHTATVFIDQEAFARLFSGRSVYRYANGTQANGMLGDFRLVGSISPRTTIEDGDYLMPEQEEVAA